jgi:hypothetical protein
VNGLWPQKRQIGFTACVGNFSIYTSRKIIKPSREPTVFNGPSYFLISSSDPKVLLAA